MLKATKKDLYDLIVKLTAELKKTDFPKKLFDTAKEGNAEEVQEVFLYFGKQNNDLYQSIYKLGERIEELANNSEELPTKIFGKKEKAKKDDCIYFFDSKIINPVSFCALTVLGWIDESELFYDWPAGSEQYYKGLKESGYKELAEFLKYDSFEEYVDNEHSGGYTMAECLVDIFNEEI